jgi:hypothetical protein
VAALIAGTVVVVARDGLGQSLYYDRNKVPGNYTIGLYVDDAGRSRQAKLRPDQESVEAFIGITGDSTTVFSGMAFALQLPEGIELDGPIHWRTIEGLEQWGALEGGVQVEFNKVCQEQTGPEPLMLGRIRFRVDPKFARGEIVVAEHLRWGCSVELCNPDQSWPKPYATGLGLEVERDESIWNKVKGIFD